MRVCAVEEGDGFAEGLFQVHVGVVVVAVVGGAELGHGVEVIEEHAFALVEGGGDVGDGSGVGDVFAGEDFGGLVEGAGEGAFFAGVLQDGGGDGGELVEALRPGGGLA